MRTTQKIVDGFLCVNLGPTIKEFNSARDVVRWRFALYECPYSFCVLLIAYK